MPVIPPVPVGPSTAELAVNRLNTNAFIAGNPSMVILIPRVMHRPGQKARQFSEREFIDLTLELDHHVLMSHLDHADRAVGLRLCGLEDTVRDFKNRRGDAPGAAEFGATEVIGKNERTLGRGRRHGRIRGGGQTGDQYRREKKERAHGKQGYLVVR